MAELFERTDRRGFQERTATDGPAHSEHADASSRESGDEGGAAESSDRPEGPTGQRHTTLAELMEETDGSAYREDTAADSTAAHADSTGSEPARTPDSTAAEAGSSHDAEPAQSPERTSARPEPSPLRKMAQQVRRLLGFDRSKVVQGVTLRGVDPETGQHFSFTSADVKFRQIKAKDGSTVGLSFSEDLQTEGDGHFI